MIGVNLKAFEAKRPTPPPPSFVNSRGLKKEKPLGVISARSLEVSLMVSQVSVIPKWSMPFLTTRSDRAGALSLIERALTVPRRRFWCNRARI